MAVQSACEKSNIKMSNITNSTRVDTERGESKPFGEDQSITLSPSLGHSIGSPVGSASRLKHFTHQQ